MSILLQALWPLLKFLQMHVGLTSDQVWGTSLVVQYLPCNAGDVDPISGQETKIPHTMELLSPRATTRESVCRCERYYFTMIKTWQKQTDK